MDLRVIPVDLNAFTAMSAMGQPVPVLDFETQQPKANRDGEPVLVVNVAVAPKDGDPAVIPVRVTGRIDPRVDTLVPVTLVGLIATRWEMGNRHGVTFSAREIRPVTPPASAGSAGSGGKTAG
ncbi:hypothetical protein [Frankia sp. Cas4]|uniref:hypothetical protein n=1 Tax=Frankia sp. Cas4 TaxID=3073927 RepID=UPI002AD1E65A|nr:hypothetical protein [Frankia sp. Cas4]